MPSLVYLLHFDAPRSHARHYLGSTLDLHCRLAQHATGNGARLTQVLAEDKQGWIVSALFQPTDTTDIRTHEKNIKNRKNSRIICPICNPEALPPAGMIRIPLPVLHSDNYKAPHD